MKNQKNALMNALPIVAGMYSEKTGVPVRIGGNVAHTDGHSVNLPVIPDGVPQQQAIWGYLAHEGAHIRFSDFQALRRRVKPDSFQHSLVNTIEDCRIEQLMIKAYPGTEGSLLETCEYMISAGHYYEPVSGDHPATILGAYCLYYMQAHGVGQPPLLPALAKATAALVADFPSTFCSQLETLLDEAIVQCDSTDSAIDYADKIIDLIKGMDDEHYDQVMQSAEQEQGSDPDECDGAESPQPGQGGKTGDQLGEQQQVQPGVDEAEGESQQPGESTGGGQGQQADNEQNADQSETGAEEETSGKGDKPGHEVDQEGAESQSSQGPGDKSDQQTVEGSSTEGGSQQSNASRKEIVDAIENAAAGDVLADPRDSLKRDLQAVNQQPFESHCGGLKTALPSMQTNRGNADAFHEARTISAGIRQQLWGMVQANQRKAPNATRSGRRINTGRLARVRAGETKVFVQKVEKKLPNAAIHILVDLSSSMETNQMYRDAREAGLAIALALESIQGVNAAVTFFDSDTAARPRLRSALKHGQRVDVARFDVFPAGSTPMAEALWHSALEVTKCKEERKMIICITDGEPDDFSATQKVISTCNSAGVELIGIGIKTEAVRRLFSESIVIKSAKDLRNTLFQLMRTTLLAA